MKAIIKTEYGEVVEYELMYGYNSESGWPHWYYKKEGTELPEQHRSDDINEVLKTLVGKGKLIGGDFKETKAYIYK